MISQPHFRLNDISPMASRLQNGADRASGSPDHADHYRSCLLTTSQSLISAVADSRCFVDGLRAGACDAVSFQKLSRGYGRLASVCAVGEDEDAVYLAMRDVFLWVDHD